MGLTATLLTIAIAFGALFAARPDTPEDDAYGIAHGDQPIVPNGFHSGGDTL